MKAHLASWLALPVSICPSNSLRIIIICLIRPMKSNLQWLFLASRSLRRQEIIWLVQFLAIDPISIVNSSIRRLSKDSIKRVDHLLKKKRLAGRILLLSSIPAPYKNASYKDTPRSFHWSRFLQHLIIIIINIVLNPSLQISVLNYWLNFSEACRGDWM